MLWRNRKKYTKIYWPESKSSVFCNFSLMQVRRWRWYCTSTVIYVSIVYLILKYWCFLIVKFYSRQKINIFYINTYVFPSTYKDEKYQFMLVWIIFWKRFFQKLFYSFSSDMFLEKEMPHFKILMAVLSVLIIQ